MLGRFVGPAGESRGRDVVEAGTRSRWTKRGWWEGERGGAIGVVVCAGTEKGGRAGSWNTGGSEKREKEEGSRAKGGQREAGTRILPKHRTIPGAALNESAFLCPAMLSKCKQRPIIYHPLRKQLPALPLYVHLQHA